MSAMIALRCVACQPHSDQRWSNYPMNWWVSAYCYGPTGRRMRSRSLPRSTNRASTSNRGCRGSITMSRSRTPAIFASTPRRTGSSVASCRWRYLNARADDTLEVPDFMHRSGSFARSRSGYWLRASAVGQGYMTEAVRLVTELAFNALQARRVAIECEADNEASLRVAERAGFILEGRLRNGTLATNGNAVDLLVYALTPDDWLRLRDRSALSHTTRGVAEGDSVAVRQGPCIRVIRRRAAEIPPFVGMTRVRQKRPPRLRFRDGPDLLVVGDR